MTLFAGILYPNVDFTLKDINGYPPSAPDVRLSMGAEYSQPITLIYGHGYIITRPDITIFVNKPYRLLHMKEMSYSWECGEGVFIKDDIFLLPARWKEYQSHTDKYELRNGVVVRSADADEIERQEEEMRRQEEQEAEPYYYYYKKDGWYWVRLRRRSIVKNKIFLDVNFNKLFRGKRPGDKFYFTTKMVYSFDDEPEIIQVNTYEVNAFKGEYVSPFNF
jgi:hypothetical protein